MSLGVVLVVTACSPSNDGAGIQTATTGPADPVQLRQLPDAGVVARALGECMRERGWEVVIDDTGVEFGPLPDEQDDARKKDMRECDDALVESGVIPDPERPPSDEILRGVYAEELAFSACLVDNGYPVPDVPSWETYRDSWSNGVEEDVWYSMSRLLEPVSARDDALIEGAIAACGNEDSGG